jgi:argininosuccinate lyase
VGALVRKLVVEKRDFDSLSAAEWTAASELFDAGITGRVTARASVEAKRTPQSTAPGAVAAALADVEAWAARQA